MHHLSVGIFGNTENMKRLGKQGTVNDIMIYNHASSDGVFTYVAPNSLEKVQPILQTINMVDIPVIVADGVTKELAEQIIFLDAFGFENGFIISQSGGLKSAVKGTSIEQYEQLNGEKELKERLKEIKAKALVDSTWVPVDNYFAVKSVGTVILSVIKGGSIRKHDKLMMQPLGKEVLVKGIQSQDKDIEEAAQGMRAGLSLKGVEAEEIRRGYVLCKESAVSRSVKVRFVKSKYSRGGIEKGNQVFLSAGLQVIPGRVDIAEGNEITLSLEHPFVYFASQKCIIASTAQVMPRIVGAGIIK